MTSIEPKIDDIFRRMDPDTSRILTEMYASDSLRGTESAEPVALDKLTRISLEQGAELHALMCKNIVVRSLEIGLAYGFSTIWMLEALRLQENSLHVSIDPFEKSQWHGIGLAHVAKLTIKTRFEWMQDFSMHALSDLIRRGEKFDFIYVDGMHRFDNVLVDFFLSDQVLQPGGLMVFDDMWMESIQTVVSFVTENRAYKREPSAIANIAVLRKIRDDDRDWRHFQKFGIAEAEKPEIFAVPQKKSRVSRLFKS